MDSKDCSQTLIDPWRIVNGGSSHRIQILASFKTSDVREVVWSMRKAQEIGIYKTIARSLTRAKSSCSESAAIYRMFFPEET